MDESTDREAEKRERKRKANREYMRRQRALGEAGTAYTAEKQRAWKAANPDKPREYRRRFKERHRERVLLEQAEYRARPRAERSEELAAYFAAVYERKRDVIRARTRQWQLDNPERYKELKQRRRARVQGTTVEPVDALSLWTGACGICDEPLDAEVAWPDPASPSLDHIVPLSKGGTHTHQNLQWTHLVCNLRKGSKIP